MSILDDVITSDQIRKAKRLGACPQAIKWLRKEPITWRELSKDDRMWAVANAHATLGRDACLALIYDCKPWDISWVVCHAHETLGSAACLTLASICDPWHRAWVVSTIHGALGRAACLRLLEGCDPRRFRWARKDASATLGEHAA